MAKETDITIPLDNINQRFVQYFVNEHVGAMERLMQMYSGSDVGSKLSPKAVQEQKETKINKEVNKTRFEMINLDRKRLAQIKKQIKDEQMVIKKQAEKYNVIDNQRLDNLKALRDEEQRLTNNFNRLNISTESLGKRAFGKVYGGLRNLGRMFTANANMYSGLTKTLTDFQAALRVGLDFNPVEAIKSGLAPDEYIKLQAEQRSVINATKGGFEQWKSNIDDLAKVPVKGATHSLAVLTGSLGEGTKAAAKLFDIAQSQGVAANQAGNMSDYLAASFSRLQKEMSINIDDFTKLHDTLLQDADVRKVMLRMNQRQRMDYFKTAEKIALFAKSMGASTEQAAEFQQQMAKMQGMDAKDRLKAAARVQAVGSALGRGEDAARMAAIMRKGSRASSDEMAELARLRESFGETLNQFTGQGLSQELIGNKFAQMTEGMFTDILQEGKAAQVGANKVEPTQLADRLDGFASKFGLSVNDFVKGMGQLNAFVRSGVGEILLSIAGSIPSIAGTIAAGLGGVALKRKLLGGAKAEKIKMKTMPKEPNKISKAAGKMKGGIGKMAGKFGGKMAGRAALGFLGPLGAIIGGGMMAYEAGSWLYENKEQVADFLGINNEAPTSTAGRRGRRGGRVKTDAANLLPTTETKETVATSQPTARGRGRNRRRTEPPQEQAQQQIEKQKNEAAVKKTMDYQNKDLVLTETVSQTLTELRNLIEAQNQTLGISNEIATEATATQKQLVDQTIRNGKSRGGSSKSTFFLGNDL